MSIERDLFEASSDGRPKGGSNWEQEATRSLRDEVESRRLLEYVKDERECVLLLRGRRVQRL